MGIIHHGDEKCGGVAEVGVSHVFMPDVNLCVAMVATGLP